MLVKVRHNPNRQFYFPFILSSIPHHNIIESIIPPSYDLLVRPLPPLSPCIGKGCGRRKLSKKARKQHGEGVKQHLQQFPFPNFYHYIQDSFDCEDKKNYPPVLSQKHTLPHKKILPPKKASPPKLPPISYSKRAFPPPLPPMPVKNTWKYVPPKGKFGHY